MVHRVGCKAGKVTRLADDVDWYRFHTGGRRILFVVGSELATEAKFELS